MTPIKNSHLKLLINETQLIERVRSLAEKIATDFSDDEIVVVGLLKGSFMFLSDLVRQLHKQGINLLIDFLSVSSYGSGTVSSGKARLDRDITTDIEDRRVLLVDDILDSGHTIKFVSDHLLKKKPAILKRCVFLDKPARRIISCQIDYVGFTVPDAFIVGYGLDYDGRYREFPYISVLSIYNE